MQRAIKKAVGYIFIFSSWLMSILLIVALGLSMASIAIPSISIITPILLTLISVVMAGPGAIAGLAIALWVLGLIGAALAYPNFFSSIINGLRSLFVVRFSYTKAQIDASPFFIKDEILVGKKETPSVAMADFNRGARLGGIFFKSEGNLEENAAYSEYIKNKILELVGETDIKKGVSEIIYKTPIQHYGINLLIHEILRICKTCNPKNFFRNSSEIVFLLAEGGRHQWSWDKDSGGVFCDIRQEFSSLSVQAVTGARPIYYAYNINSGSWENLENLYVLKDRLNDFAPIVSAFMRIRFPKVGGADRVEVVSPYVEAFNVTNYFPGIVDLNPSRHLTSSASGDAAALDSKSLEEDELVAGLKVGR